MFEYLEGMDSTSQLLSGPVRRYNSEGINKDDDANVKLYLYSHRKNNCQKVQNTHSMIAKPASFCVHLFL